MERSIAVTEKRERSERKREKEKERERDVHDFSLPGSSGYLDANGARQSHTGNDLGNRLNLPRLTVSLPAPT